MRRVEVTLKFTMDLDTDTVGISKALEDVSWHGVILNGMRGKDWAACEIVEVHPGTRGLKDIGDPSAPKRRKKST